MDITHKDMFIKLYNNIKTDSLDENGYALIQLLLNNKYSAKDIKVYATRIQNDEVSIDDFLTKMQSI